MDLVLRDIETAKQDTSDAGKRRLAALQKHKQILECLETKPAYGHWKKVEGTDIVQVLENKTVEEVQAKKYVQNVCTILKK